MPGDINEWVLLKDCFVEDKLVEDPPFPTFYQHEAEEEAELLQENELMMHAVTSRDLYAPDVHRVDEKLEGENSKKNLLLIIIFIISFRNHLCSIQRRMRFGVQDAIDPKQKQQK